MKQLHIPVFFIIAWLTAACNTLYNSTMIEIEVAEPGRVIFPPEVSSVAVRYNNANVAFNPYFSQYKFDSDMKTDTINTDSIASKLYYKTFTDELKQTFLFDSIYLLEPQNFSHAKFEIPSEILADSANNYFGSKKAVSTLATLLSEYKNKPAPPFKTVTLNPKLGLYSAVELKEIKDTTGADMLWSLDYFALFEYIGRFDYIDKTNYTMPIAFVMPVWNFYDLNELKLKYFYNQIDTVSGEKAFIKKEVPPRILIIKEASVTSGINFANFLVPHWIPVQRTIYESGNTDLKKAEELLKENKWLEAAKIWKAQTRNPNKRIAAKSMFNMAVACEIEGNLDAAVDWLSKSYRVFGVKSDVHKFNCKDYLRVLNLRRIDIKKIEQQLNPLVE